VASRRSVSKEIVRAETFTAIRGRRPAARFPWLRGAATSEDQSRCRTPRAPNTRGRDHGSAVARAQVADAVVRETVAKPQHTVTTSVGGVWTRTSAPG